MGLVIGVTFIVSMAFMVSSAFLTASEVRSSDKSLKDVNSDGLVDVVDSEEGVFWNQGDNQFYSNDVVIKDNALAQHGLNSYYAHQDPINATSLNFKPSYFIFNHVHIEPEKGSIINLYNLSTTFYEKNHEGTYLPTTTVNPNMDFNLYLHMHPISTSHISKD
jgi:hypothetical protein